MTSTEELIAILELMKKEGLFYADHDQLNQFFVEHNITLDRDSLVQLLLIMMDVDKFGFLNAVCDQLSYVVAYDEKFIELLAKISEKIQADLSRGIFINALISLGIDNPEVSLKIAQTMINKGGTLLTDAGYLLGGIGRKSYDQVYEIIMKLYGSNLATKKITAIRAIGAAFDGKPLKHQNKIFELLLHAAGDHDEPTVRLETLVPLMDFYDINPELCKTYIKNIMVLDNSAKYYVANRLWIAPLTNKQDNIELLQLCADDSPSDVRTRVYYALTKMIKDFPEEIMEFVGTNVEKYGYDFGNTSFLLEELGQVNFDKSMEVVKKWLKQKNYERVRFHIPLIVNHLLHKTKKELVIPHLKTLLENKDNLEIVLKISQEILSAIYAEKIVSNFTNELYSLLYDVAKAEGFEPSEIVKGENDSVLRDAMMIDYVMKYGEDLNYDTIFSNLQFFKNIQNVFTIKWFESMKGKKNRTHTLLRILSRNIFPQNDTINNVIKQIKESEGKEKGWQFFRLQTVLSDVMFLLDFDQKLGRLVDYNLEGFFSIKSLRTNLQNESQFEETVSEITFTTAFLGKYEVVIEPLINNKKRMDAKIKMDGMDIFVEIISPRMFKPLNLLTNVMNVKNRVKEKVYDEFKKHMMDFEYNSSPILLAIDIGRSEIDYEFVEEYLFGTLKMTMLLDKEKKEVTDTYWQRQKDAMHDKKPEMDSISAIICFKSRIRDDLTYHTEGKIIDNPYAKIRLTDDIKKKLESTLFS